MAQSKKHLLKGTSRRLFKLGVRLVNAHTPETLICFARLHASVIETSIKLQRLPVTRLSEVQGAVSYQQVAELRERLSSLQASLH